MKRAAALLLLLAALLAGCATPIGVIPVAAQETQRSMMANALSTGTASEWTMQVLNRNSLAARQREDPAGTLDDLYQLLQQAETPDRLFALAELSFLYAQKYASKRYYLAAAVFAYAFLLPEDEQSALRPIDPRARLAVDLYNQALAEGLASPDAGQVMVASASYRLPFGTLGVTIDPAQLEWAGYRFKRFVPASHFMVRGLRNRYRQSGVGAPLVADVEPAGPDAAADAVHKRISARTKVPVTAFMRIDQPLRGVLRGQLTARLELYTSDETMSLRVGGREVPLEFESTASIAYQLEGAPIWNTEISGFRDAEAPILGEGLQLLQPHRPGRIPVVFVHGTASSPARWAEMFNELSNDPALRDRYEFWLFQYNTGPPILYSALLLRRELKAVMDEFDPDRKDPALRRMVVIGHSQGGLLAKLMAVSSGTRFWDNVSKRPFDQFDGPEETRALFREGMFFEPVAQVERVVFIATPHQGSFRAAGWVQTLLRRLITLPVRLVDNIQAVRTMGGIDDLGPDQLSTSVDNMAPNTRFIRTLAELPVDPRIKANSIIPVNGQGPPDDLDDGVVAYRSAHIGGVESELVVRSGHSTQGLPATIEEVRRILRDHVGARTARNPMTGAGAAALP